MCVKYINRVFQKNVFPKFKCQQDETKDLILRYLVSWYCRFIKIKNNNVK